MKTDRIKAQRWNRRAQAALHKAYPEFGGDSLGEEVLEAYPPHPGRRMTEEEFLAWVKERTRAEWVNGEVTIMSPVSFEHDQLQTWLIRLVSDFVDNGELGKVCSVEFALRLPGLPSHRLTDLFFVSNQKAAGFQRTYFAGVPDLVLEIVSPDSIERDYKEKFNDYQISGIPEYWIIDPLKRIVTANQLVKGKYRRIAEKAGAVHSAALPGFFIKPAWLWEHPLPKKSLALREMGIK
ncbi:MAG TPA: Uma2 family endonuclease [Phycisphaerae bacterium]|nr:Uma2 family endonuclease [Phycisphaerae bacterium]